MVTLAKASLFSCSAAPVGSTTSWEYSIYILRTTKVNKMAVSEGGCGFESKHVFREYFTVQLYIDRVILSFMCSASSVQKMCAVVTCKV